MERKKKYEEGDRVTMSGCGKKMDRAAMDVMGLHVGDIVFCIDPDSEMQYLSENEMRWSVYQAEITKLGRVAGIRVKSELIKTSHNFFRDDGLWSNEEDELSL
jgi:hypothetical protein